MERALLITGKTTGVHQQSRLLQLAPEAYFGQVVYQLKKERDMFVGKRRGDRGVFRKKLERKKLWGGRKSLRGMTTWSTQFTGLIRGKVTAGKAKRLADIWLRMGLHYDVRKQVHKAMEMMGTGGAISSSKQMIIPVHTNLARVGVNVKAGKTNLTMRSYHRGRSGRGKSSLVAIGKGAKVYYYDAELLAQGHYLTALMFIGIRRVRVKKQFDFDAEWKRREPKAFERLRKAVDRATEKIRKGKVR
jgi:hypothetical protein